MTYDSDITQYSRSSSQFVGLIESPKNIVTCRTAASKLTRGQKYFDLVHFNSYFLFSDEKLVFRTFCRDAQKCTWPVHFFQLTWIQGSKMESSFTLTNLSVLTSQEHHEFNLHLHSVSAEQWIIFGIAMPTFVGLSLVFNGLIFLVLLKDKIESSLHLLLHCLSCYDIGVALFSFWIYSWPTICLHFK